MGNGTVEPAHQPVKIPKEAVARQATRDALLCFVGLIDSHPEKGGKHIIKKVRQGKSSAHGGADDPCPWTADWMRSDSSIL